MSDPNGEIRNLLESLVRENGEIGLQVAAYLDGELVIDAWAGIAVKPSGRRVTGETLFTAFSISKGITSTCIHILADRGLIDYDATIAEYWPEFAAKGKGKATVRDALAHRVGIPQDPPGFNLEMAKDWDAVCQAVAELEPLWEPGTKTGYHALTFGWVLGEVIRRVDGRSIGQFLRDEVCRPLRIEGMYFGVPSEQEGQVASLQNAPGLARLELSMTPSLSDPAKAFNSPIVRQAVIPGAGAIVNARSLARHYAMLAGGGELDGVRLLRRERVAIAALPQVEEPEVGQFVWWSAHGLGYTLGGGPGPMQHSRSAFGYEGLGTIGFADPSKSFAFAILKNLLDWSPNEMNTATVVAHAVKQAVGMV